ncbi:SCO family protein [Cupriavidus sp. SW-Y-13]|uniref:SCO family protein n=1 Tax=Cupriavidus sp. SW-Y-13 TaxID=2653854 RepID=UPI0010F615B3|nr:SCO family protein [Cupriavidus sp. SW-Y-13]MWL87252.1 SCO family protein [Cupriavidus sp. SW-Y-13]
MATRRLAPRAVRTVAPASAGPWLALAAALLLGAAAVYFVTDGLRAWTLDQSREARIARQALRLPAIDVWNQQGHDLRLFEAADSSSSALHTPAASVTPSIYIVDFIYTRCPTVCRALGAEFAQLQRQIAADGMAPRVQLISLSFDPRDTVNDLLGYATSYRANAPGWQVVAAISPDAMTKLLRQADVIAIPDGLGGFEHNGGLHVVDAQGRVLSVHALEDFQQAYAAALAHLRGDRP